MNNLKHLIESAHAVVPKITCEEFALDQMKFLIIDVREGSEIKATGAIDGAVNVPRGLIEMKLTPDENQLHADTPIVVYCGGGEQSLSCWKNIKRHWIYQCPKFRRWL